MKSKPRKFTRKVKKKKNLEPVEKYLRNELFKEFGFSPKSKIQINTKYKLKIMANYQYAFGLNSKITRNHNSSHFMGHILKYH